MGGAGGFREPNVRTLWRGPDVESERMKCGTLLRVLWRDLVKPEVFRIKLLVIHLFYWRFQKRNDYGTPNYAWTSCLENLHVSPHHDSG